MNSLSDKPGVIGAVGTLGNAVTQGVKSEVKQTVKNTLEQLDLTGNKENKEKLVETAQAPTPEQLQQQSQETANWLYGTSSPEPSVSTPEPARPEPMVVGQKQEGKADLKQQLGFELTNPNTANVKEQFGISGEPTPTANPLEQMGMGKTNTQTLSAADQLNFMPGPTLTPEEQQKQAQLKNRLHQDYSAGIHQDYHQKLNNPALQSDTEERQKEAQEEQETEQQRMERLQQEDLQKKQEEEAKKNQKVAPGVEMARNLEKNRGSMG